MNRTNDASHLYHDSHFVGVSGGALEAREQLRAREVNAREKRLLQQQDRHLRQAKDTVRRRSRWEQNSIRKDLRAILERTPTFHRTLMDEKQKLRSQHQGSYSRGKKLNLLMSESRVDGTYGRRDDGHRKPAGSSKVNTVSGTYMATQGTIASHTKNRLPPVPEECQHATRHQLGNGFNVPRRQSIALSPERDSKVPDTIGHVIQGKPVCRGERYTTPRDIYQTPDGHSKAEQELSIGNPPASSAGHSLSVGSVDTLGMNPNRGAHLRRRSHHAVMSIVRVQARHEQRMREADAAMLARAADTTRYRFSNEPSQSLAEMSRIISKTVGTVHHEMPRIPFFQDESHPPALTGCSKVQSWLSVPASQMRRSVADITHVTGGIHDRSPRPRFHSVS